MTLSVTQIKKPLIFLSVCRFCLGHCSWQLLIRRGKRWLQFRGLFPRVPILLIQVPPGASAGAEAALPGR